MSRSPTCALLAPTSFLRASRAVQGSSLISRSFSQPTSLRNTPAPLPIRQLQKVGDFVTEHLAEEISVEILAQLVQLSPFHFSRIFKQSTGMSPLRFVTRERVTRAQQLIRETSRSLIEIALDVGYTSPSHFAQVFRRVVGMTPTEFRSKL
jgi:AraC family transcriptional regulator